jgi:hypothetical protein
MSDNRQLGTVLRQTESLSDTTAICVVKPTPETGVPQKPKWGSAMGN